MSMTAYYDREADVIHGAGKGSLTWQHERGHQLLAPWVTPFIGWFAPLVMLGLCYFAWTEAQNVLIAWLGGIFFWFIMAEELLAWCFAFYSFKNPRAKRFEQWMQQRGRRK